MVLEVIFWILLLLCCLGVLTPDSTSPYLVRGRVGVLLILVAILGYRIFHSPLSH